MIVASILLAFGIDAWWDRQQAHVQERDLLQALEEDFVETRDLVVEALSCSVDLRDRADAFLEAAGSRTALNADSIRHLSVGIVYGICDFSPTLINYEAARSSGEISLVHSTTLLRAFADFDRYWAGYEGIAGRLLDSFYLGPLNDLRSELGSLSVLSEEGGRREAPSRFLPEDLNELIQRQGVFAAAEPTYVLRFNMVGTLDRMLGATDRILLEVRRLRDSDADAS